MINIQNELQKIHHKYGVSETANYKIQLLCELYAEQYHEEKVKKLNTPDVVGQSEQLPCDHDYQPDITCGVDITVCTKCGDVI